MIDVVAHTREFLPQQGQRELLKVRGRDHAGNITARDVQFARIRRDAEPGDRRVAGSFQHGVEMIENLMEIPDGEIEQRLQAFSIACEILKEIACSSPCSHAIQRGVEVGIPHPVTPGAFFEREAGDFFQLAEVGIGSKIRREAGQVIEIGYDRFIPRGHLGEFEFAAVEGRVNIGTEVGQKNGKSFAVKVASGNGLLKSLHLVFCIKPAFLKGGPACSVELCATLKFDVMMIKTDGRAVEYFLVEPSFNAREALLGIRFVCGKDWAWLICWRGDHLMALVLGQ